MPKPKKLAAAQESLNLGLAKPPPLKVSFKPTASRRDPAIWVRKLSVWSQWPPSPDSRMRIITLHRGLNILWAESKVNLQAPRIGGHGAGKTTFCRLLRFILDEKQFGTDEFRQDFRNIHDDGWVLAEVIIESKPWLVGKTLGDRGRHHFAIQGADLTHSFEEQPPIGGYGEYQKALEDAALGKLQIRSLSGSGKTLKWVHLLSWLARDQEAHYANLLAWRDVASQTEGQDLSAVDRENLICLVMGLVEQTEQDRRRERAAATVDHESKLKERVPLDFIRKRSRTVLSNALGKSLDEILGGEKADVSDDPILLQEVEARATALDQEAAKVISAAKLEDEEKDAEQRVVDKAASAKAERANCARIQKRIQELEGKPADLTAQPQPEPSSVEMHQRFMSVEKTIGDLRNLCNRTRTEAKELGCPHFLAPDPDQKTDRAISKQEGRNDAEEENKRREIQRLNSLLTEQLKPLADADSAEKEAREFQIKVKAFVTAERKRLGEPAERAQKLRDALADYQTACKESTTLTDAMKGLEDRKTELDKEILDLAEAHREVVTDFGLLFDALAKELLGDQVTGSVHLGKGIEPDLRYHGRRKSAALNLSTLLAFDLACLALGMISERAHHPRLIIHDSPRESDLAIGIYHALFRAARMLERACDGEAAFQYIVTTTESPPDDLNRDPWRLDPVLDAQSAETRFLGVDL